MTIPYGLSPEHVSIRYRKQLEQYSTALFTELRSFFALPLGEGIASASIEVFLDQTGEQPASIWIYFDGKNKKITTTDISIFPGRSLQLAEYLDELEPFNTQYFESDSFTILDIQADVVKAWFSEWWWKAGGWSYPMKVELYIHDEYGNGEIVLLAPG